MFFWQRKELSDIEILIMLTLGVVSGFVANCICKWLNNLCTSTPAMTDGIVVCRLLLSHVDTNQPKYSMV